MTSADDFVLQLIQDKGLVTAEAVASARGQIKPETPSDQVDSATLDVLIQSNNLSEEDIYKALSKEFNMEVVSLAEVRPGEDLLKLVSREQAMRYKAFPLNLDGKQLDLAISDPLNVDAIDSLSKLLNVTITTYLASPQAIQEAIDEHYGVPATNQYGDLFDEAVPASTAATGGDAAKAKAAAEAEAPIIKYVTMLISEAVKRRASDIHLEPLEKRFRVRYRIDGVLLEVENPPKRLQPPIVSRLKLMANVSLAEKRIPQDGRIQSKVGGKDIDLRVSVLPTVYGESIVMRILDKEGLKLGLPELGFFSDDQAVFERIIGMADGIFLVTGPTGSGKSTTLYSALNFINHPDKKIITVEDPVEYQMAGINQVQVRREVEMTFARALRAMLRQAPNIIMIGEIRDYETAEIAINASLTGHMVFSTLHTNDSASAVTRLVDIGVKSFLVSASLRAALAQRLVRKVCSQCKKPYVPEQKELMSIGLNEVQAAQATFMKGEGCQRCNGIGARGRMGLFELFVINEEVQQMIYENRTLVELRQKARELGMRTMREDGIRKITSGLTTIDEVVYATMA
ncbi:MAG TPA: ATPase, T2SS/T4P/T4SS family [Opitutales bacterium]|nr:ATPase, T2SS/T4P/T4SS family [Opitutales bacterium]